ncbi:low-density lipoprotein receptor-related protein 2-like [Littorina saxatilis]|uniref:Uncharacterized protein n=1 Tax=Littorina saxatilis TaxID=31220 RepID=A0AAN9BMZ5_9CAEN
MMRWHVLNAACILSVIALCHIKMTLAGGPRKMCPAMKWRCSNNKCIDTKFRCNGGSQCGSDELSCEQWTCPANRWKCSNERCIALSRKCDGNDDCGDNSDEENCGNLLIDCPSYVMEKSNVSCTCRTKNVTKPYSITWPGSSQSGSLSLTNVQRSDNGTQYTCLLTADGVREEAVYTLRVAYGPYNGQVKITPSPIIRNGSQPVTLTCTAEDTYPTPHYEWGGVPCQKPAADNTCTFIPDPTFDPGHTVTCRAESVTLNTFQQFHESVRGTATESTPMNMTLIPDCGGDFVANSSLQQFEARENGRTYRNNMYCVWRITAPKGELLWFDLGYVWVDWPGRCYRNDYINIYKGDEKTGSSYGRFCHRPYNPITTTDGLITVTFTSNYRRVNSGLRGLFKTISGCGGDVVVNRTIQTVQSPGYPARYMNNLDCVWRITAPPGFYIKFNITDFQLIKRCRWENVRIVDGQGNYALNTYCMDKDKQRKSKFSPITSISNNATIVFRARNTWGGRGFSIQVKATKKFICPRTRKFQCDNLHCVPTENVCDGQNNCGDNSDETSCDTCVGTAWKCNSTRQCIASNDRCDGETQCDDGSDEQNCERCASNAVKCTSINKCITRLQRCNGEANCPNGSDEQNCYYCNGFPRPWKCTTRQCILPSKRCDGSSDCSDGSDEKSCPTA